MATSDKTSAATVVGDEALATPSGATSIGTKVIYGSMTQGRPMTVLRKNNSESMTIIFRISPNAAINSYSIKVDSHSQSTVKEGNACDNSMFQTCFQNVVCYLSEIRQRYELILLQH